MAVRAYVRSPAALLVTLLGGVAVGAVASVGLAIAIAFHSTGAAANPTFLGGLGQLLYVVLLGAVVAVAALMWLPFSAALARIVGRRVRDQSASVVSALSVVFERREPLYRWVKTRIAVGPVAERTLTDDDVAPTEVVVGATAFVVPALVTDAPTLPHAVERANRVTPQPGRERLPLAVLAVTAAVAAGIFLSGVLAGGSFGELAPFLAFGTVIVGSVLAAALDTAWRTSVYATQDLSEGFSR